MTEKVVVVNGTTFTYVKGEGWVPVQAQSYSGGFGDNLDVSEQLAEYESWVHSRANAMLPPSLSPAAEDRDDLAQVGLVAMWKALRSYDEEKGALPAWLTYKAQNAMRDHLRPAPTKRGAESSLEALQGYGADDQSVEDWTPEALIETPDLIDGLVKAYHRGEVAKALDTLTPRQQEYVRLRFWEGMGTAALTAHFGYDPSGLWNSKRNGAKYKLREALAHLTTT